MQTTLNPSDKNLHSQRSQQYIPTFIVVCNAKGKINDNEIKN